MKTNVLKKLSLVLCGVLLILSMVSCRASDNGFEYFSMTESEDVAYDGNIKTYANSAGFADEMYILEDDSDYISDSGEVFTERKIIYTSSYNISTEEYEKSIATLDALCEKYGAYYERAESYGEKTEYTSRRAEFTVRIPQNNYKAFTSEAGTVGTVTHSSEQNKDITEQYFDTEARLESAKIREERLLEILSNAKTLDDVLLLEKELADVRYEIENFSGTLRKYDSLVSYSTATFTIREVKKVAVPVTEKTKLSQRLSSALENGFDVFYEGLSLVLMAIVFFIPGLLFVVLPIVIIIIVLVIVIKRKIRKNKMK